MAYFIEFTNETGLKVVLNIEHITTMIKDKGISERNSFDTYRISSLGGSNHYVKVDEYLRIKKILLDWNKKVC